MTDENKEQVHVDRAPQPKFLTTTRFGDFDLPPEVVAGLDSTGFTFCTPIQDRTFPVSLAGGDVAGQAQTGTGKTAAFLVTIFTRLMKLKDREKGVPSALIVAPTRELAFQIFEEAELIGKETGFSLVQVVGGIDYQKQAQILRRGVDIVICTPGRIIDYHKQGIFKTSGIKIVVVDEADRLLDLGFEKDMRYILKNLPSYTERQSMLFSATLSHRVLELTYEYMNLPEFISVTPEEVTVEGISQELFHVGLDQKFSLLLGLLKREAWHRMLIFVNTKVGVEWVTRKLKGNGLPAEMITGDLPQVKRFKLMDGFKKGSIKILVATDVASRGIHVEDITHVINYDLPQDAESYVHRIGRTARAGKTGRALTLACEKYVLHLQPLEEMLDYTIPVVWPEDDWFEEDQAGYVKVERKTKNGPSGKRGDTRGRPARSGPVAKRGPVRGKPHREIPKKPPGYFPGTLFGLCPPVKSVSEPVDKSATGPADKSPTGPSGDPAPVAGARPKRAPAGRRRPSSSAGKPAKAPASKPASAPADKPESVPEAHKTSEEESPPAEASPAKKRRPRRRRRKKSVSSKPTETTSSTQDSPEPVQEKGSPEQAS
jgi:ATP-dependent RNA helicase RhlB